MAPPRITRYSQGDQGEHDARSSQSSPPLDHVAIEAIVEQRLADSLLTLASNRHTNSGMGAGRESSNVNHQGDPRVFTYKDLENFNPKMFYGNDGVVGLTRWIEKTEFVFESSSCVEECKVKFVI